VAATLCLWAVVLACLPGPALAAAGRATEAAAAQATQATQAARNAEREQLRTRLAELRRAIAAGETSRNEAADALASAERNISDINRQLRDLDGQQHQVQAELDDLSARQNTTAVHRAARQTQLAELLHRQYMTGSQDPFRLLFSGTDPQAIQRDLAYQGYVARAQADLVRELSNNLDTLNELAEAARQREAELARIAAERQARRATLVKEQQKRKTLLANVSERLRAQRREAGALERDEKRLARVVEELARLIERQRRERELERERERKRQRAPAPPGATDSARAPPAPERKPQARPGTPTDSARHRAPERNELAADPGDPAPGSFAQLKGRLLLPLKGDLLARYGAARGDGGPSWKGIFIRAQSGAEVKAVAPGRVVFADWLRGFGNLLIVDHGDQYLSIYGNNEALYKQAGDTVRNGETVAAVGNSGGNPETGLYFELRFRERPFDPLSWARLR